jgi:hypothetical protein
MYEYVDLMLIAINLLFCGLLLHRGNKTTEKLEKLENLTITNIKNPKISRKLLNEYNK